MNPIARLSFAFLLLLPGLQSAAADGYRIGQSVYWRDDSAGGWVKATITKDYGADAVEQYIITIEGRGEEHARIGMLRPADGSPRPPMPTTDPDRLKQLFNYHPERDAWPLPTEAGRTPVKAAGPTKTSSAPNPQTPSAGASPTRPNELPAPARPSGRPAADAAVLGNGRFTNGEPMGTPGQTNFRVGKDGRKSLVTVATPGDESFIGRWDLKAGGSWSISERKDLGQGRTRVTQNYNFPVNADVLVIERDGTWFKQFAGVRRTGTWIDLGQNVVQIVGFEDDDWTGSVLKGEFTLRSFVGMWEYGRRF